MEEPKQCPRCGKKEIKVDYDENKKPTYSCGYCNYRFIPGTKF